MTLWRVALSLDVALHQLDAAHPDRDHASDGSIGDAAHAARTSDHNPWVDDPDSDRNVVTARDFDRGPGVTFDADTCKQLMADPRAKYVILDDYFYDRDMYGRLRVRPYAQVNPGRTNRHDKHLHLSVEPIKALYDSTAPWAVTAFGGRVTAPATPVGPVVTDRPTLQRGSKGEPVKLLQTTLKKGYPAYAKEHGALAVDGDFGPRTDAWVREFQGRSRLSVDGIVGPRTWRALGL